MSPRRGAPPGNRNAVKHGFYSRFFHKADLKDLENLDAKSLSDEINLLRLHVRRLSEFSLTLTDLGEYLEVLRVINLFTSNINRLIKTQVFLAKEAPGFQDMINQALEEVAGEWDYSAELTGGSPDYDLKDFVKAVIKDQAGQTAGGSIGTVAAGSEDQFAPSELN
jgi:hypothetical protein